MKGKERPENEKRRRETRKKIREKEMLNQLHKSDFYVE